MTADLGPSAVRRSVMVVNKRGLHARAAAKFVKLAATFEADIAVQRSGTSVCGSSIMGLMMLAAGPGTDLMIAGRGADAFAAVEALARLVMAGFDED